MNRQDAEVYARRWADDWNRRDLDAVLEVLRFGEDGLVVRGEALYGVMP